MLSPSRSLDDTGTFSVSPSFIVDSGMGKSCGARLLSITARVKTVVSDNDGVPSSVPITSIFG
ncbi:MAG: hypothetical protein ACXAC5_25455 [Promethearchaeota archaeon]